MRQCEDDRLVEVLAELAAGHCGATTHAIMLLSLPS